MEALDSLPSPQRDGYVAQLRRGWLLYRLGRHADAIGLYTKAIGLEPESLEARLGRLLPELAARRWHDVEATARDILERDSANYLGNLRLAFAVYNQGRHAEAEKIYRKLMALFPGETDVRTGLAWSLLKLGKRDEAKKHFNEVLDVAPRAPLALEGLKAIK